MGSDSDFSEKLVDSDFEISDDDSMFDQNIDPEAEWGGGLLEGRDASLQIITGTSLEAVRQDSIMQGREVRFTINDDKGVQAKCKHETCGWVVYASKVQDEDTVQIKTYNGNHQCPKLQRNTHANSRTKQRVLEMGGNDKEQYAMLWSYVEEIKRSNPDTTILCYAFVQEFQRSTQRLSLEELLWKAARATRVVDFEKAMTELKDRDISAFDWLVLRPPTHWSKAYFSTHPKCDIMLNNMSESFNSLILEARSKPIVHMLESIRVILMKRLYLRRDEMRKHNGDICPKL
ncbi:hypothetical protein BUALT_BualtUnG0025600 [Buddleja alternifolia]|uniref:Transposase MuDR plant domain-containing protein n=1 Tax=Buddleja alternifolia TaxID=168488 RepID=A0AAV6W3X3_9LAMI|nr:hypothetical protein BUALT_BualtUnG0025600 [Buddleja alternifolia]